MENLIGHRIGVLRDDKGGEYSGADLDHFLTEYGIRREHSIRDTPQQLGVAECMRPPVAPARVKQSATNSLMLAKPKVVSVA